LAIKAFVVPFLVGGLLLASATHGWLFGNSSSVVSWLSLLLLAGVGVLLSGIVAHGILVFFIAWLAPDSPLIAESNTSPTTMSQRLLLPIFRGVGKFARSIAPRPAR
jgi:hypothetical protein